MSQTARPSALSRLTVVLVVVAGVIVGAVLALGTAIVLITTEVPAMQTTVNGWSSTMTCGKAGNSIRAFNAIRDIAGELGVGVFGANPD